MRWRTPLCHPVPSKPAIPILLIGLCLLFTAGLEIRSPLAARTGGGGFASVGESCHPELGEWPSPGKVQVYLFVRI